MADQRLESEHLLKNLPGARVLSMSFHKELDLMRKALTLVESTARQAQQES